MQKFLLKLSLFCLPILVLALPLDLFISSNFKKANDDLGETEVWNDIYDGTASCDIAIYGSSRACHHINPQILETALNKKAYNFGMVGQHFWIQYLRHLEFIKFNGKPQLIIVSLDTFSLNKDENLYQLAQFLPNMLFNKNIHDYTSNYKSFNEFDYYLPLIRYLGKPQSLNTMAGNIFNSEKDVTKLRSKGYFKRGDAWDEAYDRAHTKKENYRMSLDQATIDLFEQFINECQNMGINLVLVYTPEYIENQQYITNREEIMNIYKQLAIKYGLTFLDYSNDEMSYQKDNFFDSTHLTGKGAGIFTAKLASKLKEININQ